MNNLKLVLMHTCILAFKLTRYFDKRIKKRTHKRENENLNFSLNFNLRQSRPRKYLLSGHANYL